MDFRPVILSGTGSDGSRGIQEIHSAGGLVVVQDPRTARFDGMPRSAIDTGMIDLELAPDAIPDALACYAASSLTGAELARKHYALPPDSPMGQILGLLRGQYGIDFAHYKPNTVVRRVERRMLMARVDDVSAYAERLSSDRDELGALYFDLLIGVTRFFRDPEAFDYLELNVIPPLIAGNHDIRVWVPGCATGEEVYSLAILFHESLTRRQRRVTAKIFATDVHPESLDRASAGVFAADALRDVSEVRRERYFQAAGQDTFRVAKELREMVVFARHNVIQDAPFTRLDLVSCRNLLIYLQPPAQKKALSLFHFGLKTGGHLFLGSSETPGEFADEFETVERRWKMYRKRRDIRLPADMRLPTAPGPRPARGAVGGRRAVDGTLLAAYDELLGRHIPPAFLVDDDYELRHSFGGAESMLTVRGGRVSTNVLDMVPEGLRASLAGALQQAGSQRKAVTYTGVEVPLDDAGGSCRVTVTPFFESKADSARYLIELERLTGQVRALPATELELGQVSRDYLTSLEQELCTTRENLQATIEELETANEELQATNEELVAANEELQSTNEELHSVNEELNTVNVEHQRKIDELTELTADMDHLLQSTDIGVLFLDEDLCIRRFTARMAAILRLLPQDVGRRFDTFAPIIAPATLLADIRRVMASGDAVEREVQSDDGQVYFLRLLPYRSKSEKRGVLLTLVDIASLRRAEAEARRLSAIVRSTQDAVVAEDVSGRIVALNQAAEELYGHRESDALGLDADLLVPPERRQEEAALRARVAAGEAVPRFETQRLGAGGKPIEVEVSLCPMLDASGKLIGMASITRDVTQRRRAEEQVRRSMAQRDQFLALLSHELRNPLMGLASAVRVLDEADLTPDEQSSAREVVKRQVRQMSRLLEDLLDSSRMRRDHIELEREICDLRQSEAGVMDAARPLAEEIGVQLVVEIPGEPLVVEADLGRLQQLQANLLHNAIRYSPPGATVRYSMEADGDAAVIVVEDQGAGIPADDLPHIFEPFFQGEVRGRGEKGMGLGLPLVQSIAQAHGGEVTATSVEGRGARFEVRLPRVVAPPVRTLPAADEPRRARAATESDRSLVLLIDDDSDSRELLGILLSHAGHEVIQAATGGEGLELLVARRPRVAIIDIGLPDMSGLDVARRAREQLDGTPVKLIALTGFGQQRDRENATAAGFDHHLVKPLDFDTIETVLRGTR